MLHRASLWAHVLAGAACAPWVLAGPRCAYSSPPVPGDRLGREDGRAEAVKYLRLLERAAERAGVEDAGEVEEGAGGRRDADAVADRVLVGAQRLQVHADAVAA
jgi:hypothetical protein